MNPSAYALFRLVKSGATRRPKQAIRIGMCTFSIHIPFILQMRTNQFRTISSFLQRIHNFLFMF